MFKRSGGMKHVKVLLVLAVVIGISAGGYYLFTRQQQPVANDNSTSKTDSIVYLPLDDWKVSLHLEDDVRDAYVVTARSDERRKVLSTPRLDTLSAQVPGCVAAGAPVTVMRVLPGEVVDGKTYDVDSLNADESFTLVADYYYGVTAEPMCDIGDTDGKINELQRLHGQLAEHASHIMTAEEIERGEHGHGEDPGAADDSR